MTKGYTALIMLLGISVLLGGCGVPLISVNPQGDLWAMVLDGGGNPRGLIFCLLPPWVLGPLPEIDINALCEGDRLYLFDWRAGELERLEIPQGLIIGEVSWSPGGERLIFSAFDVQGHRSMLFSLNLTVREHKLLVEAPWDEEQPSSFRSPSFSSDGRYLAYILTKENEVSLEIRSQGERIFSLEGVVAYEWLPSTAKLIALKVDFYDGTPSLVQISCKNSCFAEEIFKLPKIFEGDLPPESLPTLLSILYMIAPTERYLDLSPKGDQLALVLFRVRFDLGAHLEPEVTIGTKLYSIRLAPEVEGHLLQREAFYPRFSPEGEWLAYLSEVRFTTIPASQVPRLGQQLCLPLNGNALCFEEGASLIIQGRDGRLRRPPIKMPQMPYQIFWISEDKIGYGIFTPGKPVLLGLLDLKEDGSEDVSERLREAFISLPKRKIRVPYDYPTINEAIAAAHPRDIIQVAPGIYREELTITKSLTLVAEPGTKLHGGISIFTLQPIEVRLVGLTIAEGSGDGLNVWGAVKLDLKGLMIRGHRGHGIKVSGPVELTLKESQIVENRGCGLFVEDPEAQLRGGPNEIGANGADLCGYASPELRKPLVPQTARMYVRVPEDYPSLQEAIDAVAPGGIVELAPGIHIGGATVWKPITLKGTGASTLQGDREIVLSLLAAVDDVNIESLMITNDGEDVLWIYGGVTLNGVEIRLTDLGRAILAGGRARLSLVDVSIWKAMEGILLRDSARLEFSHLKITGRDDEWGRVLGIVLEDRVSLVGEQLEIRQNSAGIECEVGSAATIMLSGCLFEHNITALELHGSTRAKIHGCEIRKNRSWIFGVVEVWGEAQLVIEDSAIMENQGTGVEVRFSERARVVLRRAYIARNSLYGLDINDASIVEIFDSEISYNSYDGIVAGFSVEFEHDRPQVHVERSIIHNNGIDEGCLKEEVICSGFQVRGYAEVTLVDSQVTENADWGVAAELKACGYEEDNFRGRVIFLGDNLIEGNNTAGNHEGEVCLPDHPRQ